MCCGVLQCEKVLEQKVLAVVLLCCSVLQFVAVCCSVLQCKSTTAKIPTSIHGIFRDFQTSCHRIPQNFNQTSFHRSHPGSPDYIVTGYLNL